MKALIPLIITVFVTACPSTESTIHPLPLIPLIPANGAPTYKVYVKGLVCPACAIGLRKYLLKLPFVELIHVNYKTGLVLIYEKQPRDKGGVELDKLRITKAVEDSGYDVDKFLK